MSSVAAVLHIDTDAKGRIWVAEGIMVLEDTDGDGKADASHGFVQD